MLGTIILYCKQTQPWLKSSSFVYAAETISVAQTLFSRYRKYVSDKLHIPALICSIGFHAYISYLQFKSIEIKLNNTNGLNWDQLRKYGPKFQWEYVYNIVFFHMKKSELWNRFCFSKIRNPGLSTIHAILGYYMICIKQLFYSIIDLCIHIAGFNFIHFLLSHCCHMVLKTGSPSKMPLIH